jgi:hypothetical protein
MKKAKAVGSLLGAVALSLASFGILADPAAAATSCHKIVCREHGKGKPM